MVRRLILALAVVAVMTGALSAAPQASLGGFEAGIKTAEAQPGAPDYCGPWQQTWHVSSGGWWYFWWWRWCHNPSLPPGNTWYIDWAGWQWFGPAPPGVSPGLRHTGPPPS